MQEWEAALRPKARLAAAGASIHSRAFMAAFFFKRLLSLLAVLFCVVTITFFMIRLAPGGPFDRERKIPPQIE